MKRADIEKLDFVRRVRVKAPPQHVMDAGHAKSTLLFAKPLCGFTCFDNSILVEAAMQERGDTDWHVVPGYAFGFRQRRPTAHFWVRQGSAHFDPSWVLLSWKPERHWYCELVEPISISRSSNDNLSLLRDIALRHGLALVET
jgi:hypothetical protein